MDEVGKEVQRWGDKAMFTAEPIAAEEGPKVHLLWMTPDPLGAIAAACKMYKGEVVRSLSEVNDSERREYLQQVRKTKLQAPYEFVQFHFLIDGVTRAFTHQLVRQRTAAYAQESLRFAVKEDLPVALPPSLVGTVGDPSDGFDGDWWHTASPRERMRAQWDAGLRQIRKTYELMINSGMPAEDARGLLPHNVLTRVHYTTNFRSLLDHAGNRLCTQAQFEWRLVFSQIAKAIREAASANQGDYRAMHVYANGERGVWMAEELAQLLQPVCYQTGKCEFKANFDRPCSIRDRVDANASISRPSSEWAQDVHIGEPTDVGSYVIPAIRPAEWLLDPGAAR